MATAASSRRHTLAIFAVIWGLGAPSLVLAQAAEGGAVEEAEDGAIEEVIVTAQRTDESIQDVPIAVTALTGGMLDDKQVITVSDLQMNAPNVSFTPTNFGSNSLSIRGIGRLVTAATGDAGVSVHTNSIAIAPNLNTQEFYDLERVEVLRGPQGTLYGRNATGGVVNFVTRKPDFESVNGFVDLELGDYSNERLKGALNIPMGDRFAVRVAGMRLKRDGYTDNLAAGQAGLDGRVLEGLSDDVDGRDQWEARVTAAFQVTDDVDLWVMYTKYKEDSNRARITNQVCKTFSIPTYGCDPDEFAFETPHNTAQFSNLVLGLYMLHPLGSPNGTGVFNWPRPQLDLRSMHTDFEPLYESENDQFSFGLDWNIGSLNLGVVGGMVESEYLTRQDYNMNVDNELGPNIFRADGMWPVTTPAGGVGGDWLAGPCNILDGNSGAVGGNCQEFGYSQAYSYDQADQELESWTVEVKLQSAFEGPVNFLLGYTQFETESNGDYYVIANTLDGRPDSYPGYFNNTSEPGGGITGEGYALFGEVYFNMTDRLKLTAGIRYNDDDKGSRDSSVLWNATDANFPLSTAAAGNIAPPLWTRVPAFVNAAEASTAAADLAQEMALLALYAPGADLEAARQTGRQSPERLAIAGMVPIVPTFGETRILTGSPLEFNWKEVTGRVGIDWQMNDNTLLYAFYSRGYKPGGANPAIPPQFQAESEFDFDQEDVDSFEVGMKNTLLDGAMILNANFFVYDYSGLQVARIKNNTSLNENIDADIMGLEFEMFWRPQALENLQVDLTYSWLNTEVKDTLSVDPLDRTGGSPDWITLNNFAFLYAAKREDVMANLQTIMTVGPSLSAVVPIPGTFDGPVPVIIARSFLDAIGVETAEGVPFDLEGNQLPNAPEHTIHLGLAYTLPMDVLTGKLTARWDYYWQDDSYAREFNRVGDAIDSWDQHNLSLLYRSNDEKWEAKAWVRNLQNEDNITGHYVTSDTSGYYRNYFLTEPRIYGLSVRFNFGG